MNANQLVDRFIESCSHDLRSPILSIKGLVQVAERLPHTKEMHKCLELINDSTIKMEMLLRSLEEFLVTSHHTILEQETNCQDLTNEVLKKFQSDIDTQSIQVNQEINVEELWKIDRYTFTLLLNHLLSNAITFQDSRKKRKKISISIASKDGFTILQVSDNGIGIPMSNQNTIFQPFHKACEHSSGLGMGLFQVSKLVDKTKSRLIFMSRETVGSTFSIAIPV